MRALRKLDGAALLGEGAVGPLLLELPGILWSTRPGPFPPPSEHLAVSDVHLQSLPTAQPMQRGVRLLQGTASLDLHLSVPTPEVTGPAEGTTEIAPRAISVRTPLSSGALEQVSKGAFDLVVWSNARSAFLQSEGFVRAAVALRQAAGPAPMIWAPRVAIPGRLAFLYSLGIDLVDTTEGLWAAAEGRWLYADHDELEEGPGVVPSAKEAPAGIAERATHVEAEYRHELQRVRRAARAGRLRELVEARLVPEPRRGELLRYFDRVGYDFQEEHAPVTGSGIRPYTTKEALRRPEVERFRRRFLQRYRPPAFKRTLLLLPCSQTKPYAHSPSHRRIAKALEGAPGLATLHTVSVTSPLGLVPKELECLYPARNYDIPVTGDWEEDERRWVVEALRHLRAQVSYARVFVHLPKEEYRWLEGELPPGEDVQWTVEEEQTLSRPSLDHLAHAVREARNPEGNALPPGGILRVVREELRALARVQFPADLEEALFQGEVRLAGRPWFQRLTSQEKEDLATWREETGLWRLTVAGARKVAARCAGARVQLRGGVELRGDLFAPGVLSADPQLRIGDDVVLLRGDEVVGVGEARVPGPWIGRLARGMVVKVRHRAHGSE